MTYDATFRVWRGDADGGALQTFTVEVNDGEVVLDIIHRIQATQAGDLAVRWNCKAGKCGSCSAEVNGKPRLMCMSRLSLFEPGETITVTPMRTFPVVRDLVTDVSFNYEQARKVPPFRPRPREKDGTYRMQQVDVQRGQEFRKCIECFLCQNTCHVIRDHEENKQAFAGPRFFIRYAELDMHPLDTNDRRTLAQEQRGLGMCNITKCCTEVCPENIKITDNGIIPMKERAVDAKYDPLVWLGSKIRRREEATPVNTNENDWAGLEESARRQLERKPKDREAMQALEEALFRQGRFAEAADVTRREMAAVGRSRQARITAYGNHAWTLLCAIEAGQLSRDGVQDEVTSVLGQAQYLVGSGTVLAGTQALAQLVAGRYEDAEREARDALTWERTRQEQSDDRLTLARALDAMGRRDEARGSFDEGRALWPENPRIPTVHRRLESPTTTVG